jgi:hypothetical protein
MTLCYHPPMPTKQCSICSAPPDVLASINSQLKQRVSMKKIAAASGISKASIGRHSLKCCNRKIAETFKSMKQMRPIISWPDGRAHIQFRDTLLSPAEVNRLCMSGDFCVWEVRYSGLSDEAAQNIANLEARQQEIRDRVVAPDAAPALPDENQGGLTTLESEPQEIVFTREPEPEEIPPQRKPQSGADAMRSLLADVKNMIARRRCG